MSQQLADLDRPEPVIPPPSDDRCWGMVPVAIGNGLGWLHTGPATGGAVAVLLCPALNRDALDSHHSMRLLADAFAAAGYPALRFDYPGLADACDITPGTHWTAWRQSVTDAADWLRETTGARRILFCGLRIGATLAALAAATRPDAAGLILLAPVVRGHSYMRQLAVEARLQTGIEAADGLAFHELDLTADTVAEIGRVDLRQARMPVGLPIAIFAQSDSRLLADCIQAWRQSGADVSYAAFDGLAPLLRHNLVEECAPADFSAVLEWLSSHVPAHPAPGARAPAPAVLRPPGCTETPLRFGPDARLFGMLCHPDRRPCDLAVIIANTGRDPHYGFARFGVAFARRLAASGIASLRIDFAGLGDSIGPPGRETIPTHMFEADRRDELAAAIDALVQRGYRRFAVQGMCAGAYHGLHAALADPRIATLLLVNLPVFLWNPGDTVDFVSRKTSGPTRYLAKLAHRELWVRLLRGEVHVGRLLRAQLLRQVERTRPVRQHLAARLGLTGRQTVAERAMATLSARHARTLFLFAPDDGGFDAFEQAFGPDGAGIRAFAGAAMQVVPGLDHLLSTTAMRRTAEDLMLAFLSAPDTRLS